MNDSIITLGGFLDQETVPGNAQGTTARFRLTVSPSDDTMLPCLITDPALAFSALTDLVPGDELPSPGTCSSPSRPDTDVPLRPHARGPQPPPGQSTHEVRIERNGLYLFVFDADHTDVSVWTESGAWVGVAEDAGAITHLLADYERRQSTGSSCRTEHCAGRH